MFLLSSRVEYYIIWPRKVKLKVWTQVKGMTWPKHIMMHISRFVSIRQTHQTFAEVSGAPVNLTLAHVGGGGWCNPPWGFS